MERRIDTHFLKIFKSWEKEKCRYREEWRYLPEKVTKSRQHKKSMEYGMGSNTTAKKKQKNIRLS